MFKKEKIKDLHYSISGIITVEEIQKAADETLTEYGKTAKIPGFRPGHIPLNILRQKFNATAMGESVDKLMNKDLNDYIAEKKLRLAAAPKADLKDWKEGNDLEYTLEFDILPTLPAIDLSKFTVTKRVAKLEESEIKKSLDNLCKTRAKPEKQDKNYKAIDGDVAVIDFKGFVGKDAFEGGEAKKHHLPIGSGSFIPGFEEQIIGHKIGDKFDVKLKFPKEYHAENLAGKEARFEVEIHEILHPTLAVLNDELAKEVGQDSVEALKEHVKKILTEQYSEVSQREIRDELLKVLYEKVKLDVPQVLVVQEFEMAKAEFDGHTGHDHAKGEKFDEKKESAEAERRVKLGLILAEWGNSNKIEVTREDLQQAIWAEASRYSDPQQVFEFYNSNQDAMSMLRGMLFERKTLDMMLEQVKQKEKIVKVEELLKQAA